MQLLPASFRAVERTLGFSPSARGALASGQAVSQCISAPIWGALADGCVLSRRQILIFGTFVWGVVTTVLGLVSGFEIMFVLRCLNGVALATLMPISQSLVCVCVCVCVCVVVCV
jgi:MFS family permease